MPRATQKTGQRAAPRGTAARGSAATAIQRDGRTGRVDTIMAAAERSGLMKDKSGRIAGRVSPTLIAQAKKRTGIAGDTALIAFALANVALEDNFAETFKAARGKVDAGLKLGF